jgi:dihydropteroate synthase
MTIYPLFGNSNDLLDELRKIGCEEKAVSIFKKKFNTFPVKIIGVKTAMANIIKQEMISCKGDAVVHAKSISCGVEKTDVLLLGSESIYQNFCAKMEYQDYPSLAGLSRDLKKLIERFFNTIPSQKTRNGKIINYTKPVLMGILNMTDDSFYDGGKYKTRDTALKHAEEMIKNGADIIDIGGESTRPGAEPLSMDLEMEKVVPVVEALSKNTGVIISVDTYKAGVAEESLKAGADIINDISAASFDPGMVEIIKKYSAVIVLMHIKGTPKDMQKNPDYTDIIQELIEYFDAVITDLTQKGIKEENIIIDPGIGFGKKLQHNKAILRNLSAFKKYGLPLMIGVSRKSSIGMILSDAQDMKSGVLPAEERLYGTLGANAAAFWNGADLFRVHDVKEHSDLLKVLHSIKY